MSPVAVAPADSAPVLDRRLGTIDAAAVVVSNVIGGGILVLPAIIAIIAPHPLAIMAVWTVGGLLAFAGAMAYAELAALRPKAGGEYVYLREAYGPLPAFLTGWTSFVAGFSGAIAVSAVGFAGALGRFVPAAADTTPLLSIPLGIVSLSFSPQALIAITVIAVLSAIHAIGLGPGRVVQNALASIKIVSLLGFVAAGLLWGRGGSWEHFSGGETVGPTSLLLALVPVMFSYSGWNAAAYIAEEVRDPGRTVPRALALGAAAVTVVYVAMNIMYIYALPLADLRNMQMRVIDSAADRLFGPAVGDLLTVVSMLIVAGSISAMVFAGPRVYYAMARDGLFFPAVARVHPRFRTPALSIVTQAVWSALLVLSGTFNQIVNYTGFAVVLFAGVAVTALFVLRRRLPHEARPFSAIGYPVAPAIFALFSLVMVINSIWREPRPSAAGVVIIALGVPAYFLFHRRPSA